MTDRNSTAPGRVHAVAWLVAILVVLAGWKLAVMPGDPPYGIDASYYFQIANHVARGHGFVTTVSLYHEGLVLPSPSQVYPLWPLLLGYAGRVIGIVRAANLLPPLFYCASLVLLYFLTRAVALRVGRLRLSDSSYAPDAAHLVVLLFGVNVSYFGATSHPYTEGLSFTLAFASFLALHRFVSTSATSWAFVAGCAAGLAYLGRSQMIAVAVGTIPVLAIAAWRAARLRRGVIVYAAGAAAMVLPWILHLGRIPGLPFIPRWKSVATVAVPLYFEPGEFASTASYFANAFSALANAFSFGSGMSFTRTFGPAALLPPIAAVVVLFAMRRRETRTADDRERIVVSALIVAALFVFLVLVFFPAAFGLRHLFGWRHGLTHVFLLIPAVPYLFGRGRIWRWVTVAVLVVSIALGSRATFLSSRASAQIALHPSEVAAVSWLARHPRPPRVLTTNAQVLGSVSDAHFHWTDCNSPGLTTRGMVERLKIDYVLVYEGEQRCAYVDGIFEYLRGVQKFEDRRTRVYLLAPR